MAEMLSAGDAGPCAVLLSLPDQHVCTDRSGVVKPACS